jgi:transposase
VKEMASAYIVTQGNAEEIRSAMKKAHHAGLYRRMEAVALRGEGKSNRETAEITKLHEKRVSQLVSLYCNKGLKALSEEGRKGGNRRNMTALQEKELLKEFKKMGESGQMITPIEIKKRYDEAIGRETKPSFIYAVLKRNNWRKVMPRSKHPKRAIDEAIAASKKLKCASES